MRTLVIAAIALLAACSPPHEKGKGAPSDGSMGASVTEPNPEHAAMAQALAQRAGPDIGVPVTFTITSAQTEGDWAFIVAQPWSPEGAALDWSQTHYAQRAEAGALDGNGATYALLKRENGAWRVVDFAVGPTDAAYADWPQRYGAPASIIPAPRGK